MSEERLYTAKDLDNAHKAGQNNVIHNTAPETNRRLNILEKNMVTKDIFKTSIDDLKELFNNKFDVNKEEHEKILIQQAKTNGSVKDLKAWRLGLVMSWTVVTILFPILFYYFMQAQELKTDQKIQAMINENNNKFFELNK